MPDIVDRNPIIEEILDARQKVLGPAPTPYGGHVYRVFNFCRALHPEPGATDAIAVASAFHDLGVFPDGNLDYLGRSIAMMRNGSRRRGARRSRPRPRS
jgi:hypothetical protein